MSDNEEPEEKKERPALAIINEKLDTIKAQLDKISKLLTDEEW